VAEQTEVGRAKYGTDRRRSKPGVPYTPLVMTLMMIMMIQVFRNVMSCRLTVGLI